jgi:hypothetical protein
MAIAQGPFSLGLKEYKELCFLLLAVIDCRESILGILNMNNSMKLRQNLKSLLDMFTYWARISCLMKKNGNKKSR